MELAGKEEEVLAGYWEQPEGWFQLSLCKNEGRHHQILAFQNEPEIWIFTGRLSFFKC